MAERITQGETLDGLPAESWNEFVSAAAKVAAAGTEQKANPPRVPIARGLTLPARNDSGADLAAEFPIVRMTDPLVTPTDYANIVRQGVVLGGQVPDATNATWGIMQGPAEDGRIMETAFRGVTWCDVNVTNAAHEAANPTSGDADKLTSAEEGQAKIIYKPAGTGTLRCLVEIVSNETAGGPALWICGTLNAGMTGGSQVGITVTSYGGPSHHSTDPGSCEIGSCLSYTLDSGTKVVGILKDGAADPKVYELAEVEGSGGGGLPDAGCALTYDDATTLSVDTEILAGDGLLAGDSSSQGCTLDPDSSTYCCLYVDIGCGLKFTGNKIEVDVPALAGRGLQVGSNCDLYAAYGTGDTYCCIEVLIGCGLKWNGDAFDVDVETLAGPGIGFVNGTGDCYLYADIDTNYLSITVGGKITLNLSALCDYVTENCGETMDVVVGFADPCYSIVGGDLQIHLQRKTIRVLDADVGDPADLTCTIPGVETCGA